MQSDKIKKHCCIVNVGLFKTGTTTLSEIMRELGLKVFKDFDPTCTGVHRRMLFNPVQEVERKIFNDPDYFKQCITHDFVSDGWFALLPFSLLAVKRFAEIAHQANVQLMFVVTERDLNSYIKSELHHWVRNDLEKKADLKADEKSQLEVLLKTRYHLHKNGVANLSSEFKETKILRLEQIHTKSWSRQMQKVCAHFSPSGFEDALHKVGKSNSSPDLPIEALLLTMRVTQDFDEVLRNVNGLLDDIELDLMVRYLVVVAIDDDEFDSAEMKLLVESLKNRKKMHTLSFLRNPRIAKGQPIPICMIWKAMALRAFELGASWVIFLGDDVRIHCPYHYRSIYRAFLDIKESLSLQEGIYFGCPWFNDEGFKGFPTFPIVGRAHYNIYSGFIPKPHQDLFINQDLDPYLHRLYLKFGSSPCLSDVKLSNHHGGNDLADARYDRVPAIAWREKILESICIEPIEQFLQQVTLPKDSHSKTRFQGHNLLLCDVIVPSYRINLDYLERICMIHVPLYMRTTFIIIIDNPAQIIDLISNKVTKKVTCEEAGILLEDHIRQNLFDKGCSNNIRIRCNKTNMGASASRNRGINESAAEYILFLDDDVIPKRDILQKYGEELKKYHLREEKILGLVGLVRFPRDNISILHSAVLMSYLTFMFEIAENPIYSEPAWGVTANILFRKCPSMQFDTCYAKTGGGEDVDFALRYSSYSEDLKLKTCPSAEVEHLFWSDNLSALCYHFFFWAVGDSALFERFQGEYVYSSFPNLSETLFISIILALILAFMRWDVVIFWRLLMSAILMFGADVTVDIAWKRGEEFKYRRSILEREVSFSYTLCSHVVANFYVFVLECGRLCGHLKRGQYKNIRCRFDWHCNRLKNSRCNFVERERLKFSLFIVILLIVNKPNT